jgi:hypothetical protein
VDEEEIKIRQLCALSDKPWQKSQSILISSPHNFWRTRKTITIIETESTVQESVKRLWHAIGLVYKLYLSVGLHVQNRR